MRTWLRRSVISHGRGVVAVFFAFDAIDHGLLDARIVRQQVIAVVPHVDDVGVLTNSSQVSPMSSFAIRAVLLMLCFRGGATRLSHASMVSRCPCRRVQRHITATHDMNPVRPQSVINLVFKSCLRSWRAVIDHLVFGEHNEPSRTGSHHLGRNVVSPDHLGDPFSDLAAVFVHGLVNARLFKLGDGGE